LGGGLTAGDFAMNGGRAARVARFRSLKRALRNCDTVKPAFLMLRDATFGRNYGQLTSLAGGATIA